MQRDRTFSALRWVIAGSVAQRAIAFLALGAIARLIGKEDFGVFRQLATLHTIVVFVLPVGFDQLVVREKERRAEYMRALGGAAAVTFALVAAAVLAGHAYLGRALGMGADAWLLSMFPVVLAFQAAKCAIKPGLIADLNLRSINLAEFANTAVAMGGGIALLFVSPTPLSLYAAFAAGEITEWLMLRGCCAAPTRVPWGERLAAFAQLLGRHGRFCAVYTTDVVLNMAGSNAPVLMLGARLGQGAVGVFAMALTLTAAPVMLLAGAVGRVAFPMLAARGEEQLRRDTLRVVRCTSAIVAPAAVWLMIHVPIVARYFLGESWAADMGSVPAWLCAYLVLVGVFSPVSSLDVLRDRPDVGLLWNAATLLARVGALFAGARGGLESAAAAYAMASVAMWLVYGVLLAWLLGCGQAAFAGAWLRYVPAWLMLGAAWWAIRAAAGPHQFAALCAGAVPGVAYLALLFRFDGEVSGSLMRLAGRRQPA